MILDCVLTAVNEKNLYLQFVPIFIKTWNKLYPNVDVKIILISTSIPENLKQYTDNIILFKPIENILTSFTSQFIRLLYPCILNYQNGVMITDMDMLPMNRTYYTDNIKLINGDKFIYFRENIKLHEQFAMCYNVASPQTWKKIFNINSLDDIINKIKEVSSTNLIIEGHGKTGWNLDQIYLYKHVMKWNKNTNNLVYLNDKQTKFRRLCRATNFDVNDENLQNNIINGKYVDYHCYRPMDMYSDTNWKIYNLL